MPAWVAIYAIAVSVTSMGAVLMVSRITKRQRRMLHVQHDAVMVTVCAARNMWDTLTPEQIRSLHPNTVEVGNGLPPWDVVLEWFDDKRFLMRSEGVDE